MQRQRQTIDQLLGMQPLRVPSSQELRPTLLQGASFSRPGGYERVDAGPLDFDFDKALTPSTAAQNLIGVDPGGLYTLRIDGPGLLIGRGLSELAVDSAMTLALLQDASAQHLPSFGGYATKDLFLGVNGDDAKVEPGALAPTFELSQSDEGSAGDDTMVGAETPDAGAAYTYDTGTDRWIAVQGDQAWYTGDFYNWATVPVTISTGKTFRAVDSNGSITVAVGDGGAIAWSSDGGATWSDATSPTTESLRAVKGMASQWVAVGGSDIIYDADGSATSWSVGRSVSDDDFTDIDYDHSMGVWVACEHSSGISSPAGILRSPDGQTTWTTEEQHMAEWRAVANNGQGAWVAVASSDSALNRTRRISTSQDGGLNWSDQLWAGTGRFWDVTYNGSHFWVVGEKDGGPYIYRSPDGTSWTDVTDSFGENEPLYQVVSLGGGFTVAFTSDDRHAGMNNYTPGTPQTMLVLEFGDGPAGTDDAEHGGALEPGEYDIIWLAVVPTRAGKLVVDLGRQEYSLHASTGNRISVTVSEPTVDLVDLDARVEVYLRFAPEETDDATGDVVQEELEGREYVLAATIDAPASGGSDETLSLEVPEVGVTLADFGNVGTMGVDGPMVQHQARVWAVPSANEDNYRFARGEPEVNALKRPMTVMHSDIGYANLTAAPFYLNLPQGASSKVTGLLSTVNGLMVFGENDAYIIAGDPATGDLQAEPFPDAVGCDDGQSPVALGGRIFTIWQNRLYMLDGAQAQDVSRGVFDGQSSIVSAVPDIATNSVAVMTGAGVLHFDLRSGEWYRHEVWRDAVGAEQDYGSGDRLLPNPDGLHVLKDDGGILKVITYDAVEAAEPIVIEWRDLDAGEPLRRDYWRFLRVPIDIEDAYGITSAVLTYRAKASQPAVSSEDAAYTITGKVLEEEIVFRLPWGLWSRNISMRLVIVAAQRTAILPGISLGFSPGHEGDVWAA